MNDQLHLSRNGATFIAQSEGCVLRPYNDPWNATIGIGHLIHYGLVTSADVARYRGFTYADALKLFAVDIRSYEAGIRTAIRVALNQNQFDALCSLTYNCGTGILNGTVGALVNQQRFAAATQAWQSWCHGNGGAVLLGLVRRRQAEASLFLKPSRPPHPFVPFFPEDERSWEDEYDRLKASNTNPKRVKSLIGEMTKRRQLIWDVATTQCDGWRKANRLARYNALKARTSP